MLHLFFKVFHFYCLCNSPPPKKKNQTLVRIYSPVADGNKAVILLIKLSSVDEVRVDRMDSFYESLQLLFPVSP